ncbi:MAG TPA: FIST N-terminal domain-containing protein [Syntrophorhabdaceae bacterium]|jgi:hypothetical protein
MTIRTACSEKEISGIGADIKAQIGQFNPTFIVFFASSSYDPGEISEAMKVAFGDIPMIGSSTAGEIGAGKMLQNSIVAMFFDGATISDMTLEVVEDVRSEDAIPKVFARFENHFALPMAAMDIEKYVGIILVDGLTGAEERLMERIGDLTDVIFIGGSAGDDLKFTKTFVYANGKAYDNGAVLALLRPTKGFDIIKTQSFTSLGVNLMATEVEEEKRKVISFNGKPAVEAYAEAVGVSPEAAAEKFMSHPVGLSVGNDFYVRSPQQVQDSSIVFYCNIKEGMDLKVLSSTNIVEDTKKAVEDKIEEMGGAAGIINFHCILRTLELMQKGQCEAYGKIFSSIPTIGFSTYGEEYMGHINQTSTMLLFK